MREVVPLQRRGSTQGATVRTVRTLFFPDNVRTVRVRYFDVRCRTLTKVSTVCNQGRSQKFDLGGYKWVKETKQPHKNVR